MIIDLFYGLGNQMFIYAFGEYCKYKRGLDVKYNIKGFGKSNTPDTKREIDILNFPNVCINRDDSIFAPNYHLENNLINFINKLIYCYVLSYKIKRNRTLFSYDSDFVDGLTNHDIVFGFFQSYAYINPIEKRLREQFHFSSKMPQATINYLNAIKECNSISMHLRRGDYVGSSMYSSLDDDYYQTALSIIFANKSHKDFVLFIFSDDLEWVKGNLSFLMNYNCIFVEGNTTYDDMRLMSSCNHNIIANSTFSWWGAWLNTSKEKIVVAPSYKRSFSKPIGDESSFELYPPNWIVI